MSDTLAKLFGSQARVKILRLLLANQNSFFTLDEIAKRTRTQKDTARKEINLLVKLSLVDKTKEGRVFVYKISPSKYMPPLASLLLSTSDEEVHEIVKKIASSAKIDLLVLTGVFLPQRPPVSVDMLIVANSYNDRKLKNAISAIEASLGKEIKYAVFSVKDFQYRIDIHDRLVRDVFDYPHQVLVDKKGLQLK